MQLPSSQSSMSVISSFTSSDSLKSMVNNYNQSFVHILSNPFFLSYYFILIWQTSTLSYIHLNCIPCLHPHKLTGPEKSKCPSWWHLWPEGAETIRATWQHLHVPLAHPLSHSSNLSDKNQASCFSGKIEAIKKRIFTSFHCYICTPSYLIYAHMLCLLL